jgi:hypothetical protein
MYYPAAVGRKHAGIKRAVVALQKADADAIATQPTGSPAMMSSCRLRVLVAPPRNASNSIPTMSTVSTGSSVSKRRKKADPPFGYQPESNSFTIIPKIAGQVIPWSGVFFIAYN